MNALEIIKNNIIISLQAQHDEPLYDENCIIAMAKTLVELGGVKALRLAGERDIENIKKLFPDVVVIGITKPDVIPQNYKELVYITPSVADCKKIIEAGADIVAFDATMRDRGNGEKLKDLIDYVKSQNKLAMGDIATFFEAQNACKLGIDIVSTTLSGYTEQTTNKPQTPDFELVREIKENLEVFTILEGKVWERSDVQSAIIAGADSVVIGSAVTRPQLIAKRFQDVFPKQKPIRHLRGL